MHYFERNKIVVIGLLAVVLVFTVYKLQYLNLPFFWDEAWVYAPAVYALKASGLSLMPTAIAADLSRGHPLLFHNLAAAWLSIFGSSISAAHSFSLFLAICHVLVFAFALNRLISKDHLLLLAICLLAIQPIFLAQSGLLLPEMQMSLFCFAAFGAYLQRKTWLQGSLLLAALFTKESAIVCAIAFGVTETIMYVFKKIGKKELLKSLLLISSSLLGFALYFIKQKSDLGWYFFPEHIGFIDTSLGAIFQKLERYAAFVFVYQGRIALTTLFLIGIFFRIKNRSPFTVGEAQTLLFSGFFIGGFLVFSAMNFYSDRYMLVVIPFLVLATILLFQSCPIPEWLKTGLVFIVFGFQLISGLNIKGNNDHNMSYVQAVQVFQKAVAFTVENGLWQKKLYAPFLLKGALQEPVMGYVNTTTKFEQVESTITEDVAVALFSNIDDKTGYEEISNSSSWLKINRLEQGNAWVEIYLKQ